MIFGGAGDLAHRKLLPALYNLHVDRLLPPRFAVVGVGRQPFTDEAYRDFAKDGTTQFSRRPPEDADWQTFAQSLFYQQGSIEDAAMYRALGARLDTIEHEHGLPGNRIYYLAVPPTMFVPTVQNLAAARLVRPPDSPPFARLIVEKPIGRDLASARAINDEIAAVFDERQIYRIDHYLGKETVQNILVLRFANSIFEPLFNQKYIDHVQITVAEEEGRRHARRLLRGGGRAARHGAEPHPAARRAGGDGAAAVARRRRRARREAGGHSVAAPDCGRGGRCSGRPRAVCRRLRGRGAGARLP